MGDQNDNSEVRSTQEQLTPSPVGSQTIQAVANNSANAVEQQTPVTKSPRNKPGFTQLLAVVVLVIIIVVGGVFAYRHFTSSKKISGSTAVHYSTKKMTAGRAVFYISFSANAVNTHSSATNTRLSGTDLDGNKISVAILGPNPTSQDEQQSSCSPLSELSKVNILGTAELVCGGASTYGKNIFNQIQSNFEYKGSWYGLNITSLNPSQSVDLNTFGVIAKSLKP